MAKQPLIALDQFLNTLVRDHPRGPFGWADETISSRACRLAPDSKTWAKRRDRIDWLFYKLFRQDGHCRVSFERELQRRHLPPAMRVCAPEN